MIIEAFVSCLPGFIIVLVIAAYQVIKDREVRKSFEKVMRDRQKLENDINSQELHTI